VTPTRPVYVSNYEHVRIGSTILQGQAKSTTGYIVFNSHTQFVQHYGPGNNVTREIALKVIDSVVYGRYPKGMKYDAIKAFVQGFHLLEYEVLHITGTAVYNYKCRCKGGRSEGECSHEAAGEEINKTFSVSQQLEKITSGRVRGRPRLSDVAGYRACKQVETPASLSKVEGDFGKLVNELIVQFFHLPYSQKPFVGKVTGTCMYSLPCLFMQPYSYSVNLACLLLPLYVGYTKKPTSKSDVYDHLFKVSYEAQNGEEAPSKEELTYAQVVRGRTFYAVYYKEQKLDLKK